MKLPKCIKAVAKHAGKDGRYALTNMRCESDGWDNYRYVATDGSQIVCVSSGHVNEEPRGVVHVNAKELARAVPKSGEEGILAYNEKNAWVDKTSGLSYLTTDDITYPGYRSAFKHQLEDADYRPIRLDAKKLKAFCDTIIAARKDAHFTLYMSDKDRAICITTESDDGERIHGMLMPLADDWGRELPDVREAMNLDGVTEEVTA